MMRITFFLFLCLFSIGSLISSNAVALESPIGFKEGLQSSIKTTTSISQHGITWIFAEPVQSGQFVNGDYWVVDPGAGVKITNITPGHTIKLADGRILNGSMINPSSATLHGYDSAGRYSAALNVGRGISGAAPLTLTSGSSLVSTISVPGTVDFWNDSLVKTAAVLTCLSSAPPSGSFRPGLSGNNKTLYNQSMLQRSLLKKLPYSGTKPNIATYAGYFQMAFLSHAGNYADQNLHPVDSGMDDYYFPLKIAEASLILHLDYTDQEKESLLINFVQFGIDLFSYLDSGANGWLPEGGYGSGKKWPILFAGIMLDASAMKNIGQVSGDYIYNGGHGPGNWPAGYKSFSEDGQTFYVRQEEVNQTTGSPWNATTNPTGTWGGDPRGGTPYPYTSAMIGMPEWGIEYAQGTPYNNSSWTQIYRTIGTAVPSWMGYALSARIMGVKSLWNHNAFFDYVDRHVAIRNGGMDPFGFKVQGEYSGWGDAPTSTLVRDMWNSYRSSY